MIGASPRFGCCYLRLRTHVLARTTFCYPDSHFEQDVFGLPDHMALLELAEQNAVGLDPILDNYIAVHVHLPLNIEDDGRSDRA